MIERWRPYLSPFFGLLSACLIDNAQYIADQPLMGCLRHQAPMFVPESFSANGYELRKEADDY